MIEERDLFERAAARFDPPTDAFERFTDRRERRQRSRRVAAGVVSAIIVLLLGAAVLWSLSKTEEDIPAPPPDVFAAVHGWIARGGPDSVEAIDPADPSRTRVLSNHEGMPLAWSADGSQLLVLRGSNLVVLKSDGTETTVTEFGHNDFVGGGSFTPDGSAVVYENGWSIYSVPVTGGEPTVLMQGHSDSQGYALPFFRGGQLSSTGILAYEPVPPRAMSGIWLMNLDGSDQRKLISTQTFADTFGELGLESISPEYWSPDGSQLLIDVVSIKRDNGSADTAEFVINADGTGLTRVTPVGISLWSASFSPDGESITGVDGGVDLVTISLDGSEITRVEPSATGPPPDLNSFNAVWNPAPRS